MLEELRIHHLALVDSIEFRFKSGLNILSGETGTGKSVIIQAISLLLGGKTQTDLIRAGSNFALVEGIIDISETPWVLDRLNQVNLPVHEKELLIKRTLFMNGKNRISINGELTTLSHLQYLTEGLIDLCGQQEHQSLMKTTYQLECLDRYGSLLEITHLFKKNWTQHQGLLQKEKNLFEITQERFKKIEFLKFQIQEIELAVLQEDEDVVLQREKQQLQTLEVNAKNLQVLQALFDDEDRGILSLIRSGFQKIKNIQDPTLSSLLSTLLKECLEKTEICSLQINKSLQAFETKENQDTQLENILKRLSFLSQMKKKYGLSLQEIKTLQTALKKELDNLENQDNLLEQLQKERSHLQETLTHLAFQLSQGREKMAPLLSQEITKELQELKMNEAVLRIELKKENCFSNWQSTGAETIQFLIQTNPGEPSKPLGKIVSGGELSRLMLAVRNVIAEKGVVGVYLFDEIDSGIGGETAFLVGRKLKAVSTYHQVICITHLPQVACFADQHWVVEKTVLNPQKRVVTQTQELTWQGRQEELARMLGGPTRSQKNRANAEELLTMASQHPFPLLKKRGEKGL